MPRMSEDSSDRAKDAARKAREERLAAALRANLRRLKAAGRISQESAGQEPPGTASELDDTAK